MKKKKDSLKKILKSCAFLTYIIPLILFSIFFYNNSHLIWYAIISLLPGIYALSFALIYGEMESALRGSGSYRGYKAVIISFEHFWFFMLFGLWVPLMYFWHINGIESWWSLSATAGVMIIPRVIIFLAEKKDKKPVSEMNYWIQTSDLKVKDREQALTLKEAQNFIINYNWKKEIFNKKILEKRKKETCPPTIGLDYQGQIFTISSTGNDIFELHIDTGNDRRDIKRLSRQDTLKLIEHYYNKDYDKILGYFPLN